MQHKISPDRPRLSCIGYFSSFWPLFFKVNMERSSCRECAEVLIQLHSMQCMMQPWCNCDLTWPKKTNITMLHHVTQEQTHPHIDSYGISRLLRHFVVLSQRHSDFGAWAHKVSGRFFSATQQQVKQVPGHCHYRPLGAVGIADTSILQLVLNTNSQRQHGKVKLQGMRRNSCRSKAILCLVFCQRPNLVLKTKLWCS